MVEKFIEIKVFPSLLCTTLFLLYKSLPQTYGMIEKHKEPVVKDCQCV